LPRHATEPGGLSIRLAEVERRKVLPCFFDRTTDRIFLDVHVEGVEQNAARGAVDLLDVCERLLAGVEQILLEAIDDLHIEDHIVVFRDLYELSHAFFALLEVGAFVGDTFRKGARPRAVDCASYHSASGCAHRLYHGAHEPNAVVPYLFIQRRDVVIGGETNAV